MTQPRAGVVNSVNGSWQSSDPVCDLATSWIPDLPTSETPRLMTSSPDHRYPPPGLEVPDSPTRQWGAGSATCCGARPVRLPVCLSGTGGDAGCHVQHAVAERGDLAPGQHPIVCEGDQVGGHQHDLEPSRVLVETPARQVPQPGVLGLRHPVLDAGVLTVTQLQSSELVLEEGVSSLLTLAVSSVDALTLSRPLSS